MGLIPNSSKCNVLNPLSFNKSYWTKSSAAPIFYSGKSLVDKNALFKIAHPLNEDIEQRIRIKKNFKSNFT